MGTSATRAKTKYEKENYDQIKFRVKKGEKEKYKEAAKKEGYNSLNEFILSAIEEKVNKVNKMELNLKEMKLVIHRNKNIV